MNGRLQDLSYSRDFIPLLELFQRVPSDIRVGIVRALYEVSDQNRIEGGVLIVFFEEGSLPVCEDGLLENQGKSNCSKNRPEREHLYSCY